MKREHVHLLGIGGTGMTALAGLLAADGCRVTGSDRALYPPTSEILARLDVEVFEGFDPAALDPAPDLVVVGNAISRGNPEVEDVLDRGLRYTSMPRLIHDRFLPGRHSIVVAGTHGKTTTASLLAWVLTQAGLEPGFLIGGQPLDFELPFRLGDGVPFVIEGDEYDTAFFDKGPKFMHYRPDTALLGTVEFDHADIYRDIDHVRSVFSRLALLVPRRGLLVRYEECETTVAVTRDAPCRVEGYGVGAGRWRATDIDEGADGASFTVTRDGEHHLATTIRLGGEHNVRNALAVVAAAHELGVEPAVTARAIASFRGVRRRLESRGEPDGVLVVDDFAHHPTAIEQTIEAAAARHPGRRLWAVLEPRSWSLRRNVFQDRLARAFGGADEVLVAAVYQPERLPDDERLDVERLCADIGRSGPRARHLADADAIADVLLDEARPGDVVLVMSNGGFDGLHDRLLGGLADRAARRTERPA